MSEREKLAEWLEAAELGPEPNTRLVWIDDLDAVIALLRSGEEPEPIFSCPSCGDPSASVVGGSLDIHSGATYRCSECDARVIFEALTVEQYVQRHAAPVEPRREDPCIYTRADLNTACQGEYEAGYQDGYHDGGMQYE